MKRFVSFVFFLVFKINLSSADCMASETQASGKFYEPREHLCPGDLIFEDTFERDLERWQHETTLWGGGNKEFQYYSNSKKNSYVEDGQLHIKPTYLSEDYGEDFLYNETLEIPEDVCTNSLENGCKRTGTSTHILNPIMSARIRTPDTFSFRYGTVEVRAKMPTGDWLWPAIWLLPTENKYGTWPASGEIDLLESRGNKKLINHDGVNIGTEQVGSTLHWGPDYFHNNYYRTHFDCNNETGYNTGFHIYKVVWNSTGFNFYFDDEHIGGITPPEGGFWEMGDLEQCGLPNPWINGTKMAPFDQKFHLIINLAVGGKNGFFPDDATNPSVKPWSNGSPTAMTDFWKAKDQWESTWNRESDDSHLIVDYVRVYAV